MMGEAFDVSDALCETNWEFSLQELCEKEECVVCYSLPELIELA